MDVQPFGYTHFAFDLLCLQLRLLILSVRELIIRHLCLRNRALNTPRLCMDHLQLIELKLLSFSFRDIMIASTIKCCTRALRKHLFHRCLAAAFDFSQNLPLRMHQLLLSQYPGIYFLLLKQSYFEAFLERRCLVISSAFLELSKLPLAPILSSASQIHL